MLDLHCANAFGNALGNSIVGHYQERSLPEALRDLDPEQRARVQELAGRTGANINNADELSKLIAASETANGGSFSRAELIERTEAVLKLAGATEAEVSQVVGIYDENRLLPGEGKHAGSVQLGFGEASSYDLDDLDAAFGSGYVDEGLIGAGKLFESIATTINDNPVAKYALIGLDIAAGPVAFAAREAISRSPVGEYIERAETAVSDFVAGRLVNVGNSISDSERGGVGALGLIGSVSGGATKGFNKAVRAVDEFAQRGRLRKSLGITDSNYVAHHLIPVAEARNSSAVRYAIEKNLFELNGAQNGIPLPRNVKTALATGKPLHSGPHRDYSQRIETELRVLDRDLKAGKLSDLQLKARLDRIQSNFRSELENSSIQLSSKDPNF